MTMFNHTIHTEHRRSNLYVVRKSYGLFTLLARKRDGHSVPETGLGFKKYTIDELWGIELDMS